MGKDCNKGAKRDGFMSNRSRNNLELAKQTQIYSNARKLTKNSSCRDLLVPHSVHGFQRCIPKHITTGDDSYALRCFGLIRGYAFRAAAWKFTAKVDALPDDLNNLQCPLDITREAMESSSLCAGTQMVINSNEYSTVNISRSQFDSVDSDISYGKIYLFQVNEPVRKPIKEEIQVIDHKRVVSGSITNSSLSDKSPSVASVSSLQGMLQCTWKDGLPQYVFVVDDKREILLADLSKEESSDEKAADYVYTFHSSKRDKKDCDSKIVGKMRVSTSITIGCDNMESAETMYVLSVPGDEYLVEEIRTSDHHIKKAKRLTKKMTDAFKSNHSFERTSSSKPDGSSAAFFEEKRITPDIEMAAIIIKRDFEASDSGGWGLKFLKNLSSGSTTHHQNNECSTSMNVLIPAGVHGGPRTAASSLVERWVSGGQCDCGGWDLGCPLTVFSRRLNPSHQSKSVDLCIEGDDLPMLKMVNINEASLYYIGLRSQSLSILQSFAIATAIIDSRSKLYIRS